MRVILAGGGTGGHVFPGLAIAEELKRQERGSVILFVVNKEKLPSDLVSRHGFGSRGITTGSLVGGRRWRFIWTILLSSVGFMQSLSIIRSFKPDIVVGLGSYVSGPLVLAAVCLRKATIIQEQNYIPGLATRFLSRLVNEVEVAFPGTESFLGYRKVAITGNPIRRDILTVDRAASIRKLGLRENRSNLIIFGGSRGAHRINQRMLTVLGEIGKNLPQRNLFKAWQVVHITGTEDHSSIMEAYKSQGISAYVSPFVESMENIYAVADMVVCRAGGNTIAEITARGLPAIYIPYPWASGNHQEYNARWVCERGAGELVLEGELSGLSLRDCLIGLMCDEARRRKLALASKNLGRPEAASLIVERMRCLKR